MSDEIAGQLARLPGLEVIGREGVKRFQNSQESPRDIARQLGAAYVLSGTVRWAKQTTSSGALNGAARVRIVPTLLDVQTGTQKWGQPYEEPLTDVFQVQASVAEQVAAALSVTLGDTARAALHHRESANPDAQDAQLRGRYLLRQRGARNLHAGGGLRSSARSRSTRTMHAHGPDSPKRTHCSPRTTDSAAANPVWRARADSAAQRAFALDSTLPEVQIALARAREVDYRFREALPTVQRAVALDPNGTLGYVLEYEVLSALGRKAEADTAIRRAFVLDSLSPLVLTNLAIVLAGGREERQRDSPGAARHRAVAGHRALEAQSRVDVRARGTPAGCRTRVRKRQRSALDVRDLRSIHERPRAVARRPSPRLATRVANAASPSILDSPCSRMRSSEWPTRCSRASRPALRAATTF